MPRRMRLVHKLLEHVEIQQTEHRIPVPEIDGYSEGQVHYHVGLCQEAGYLVVRHPVAESPRHRFRGIERLTWKGHEALDNIRAGQTAQ